MKGINLVLRSVVEYVRLGSADVVLELIVPIPRSISCEQADKEPRKCSLLLRNLGGVESRLEGADQ